MARKWDWILIDRLAEIVGMGCGIGVGRQPCGTGIGGGIRTDGQSWTRQAGRKSSYRLWNLHGRTESEQKC